MSCEKCIYSGRPSYIDPCACCEKYNKFEMKKDISQWTSVKEKLPESNGEYLCVIKGYQGNIRIIAEFAKELNKADVVFKGKNRPGFYDFDTDCGYFERNDVIYWTLLPELPKG